MLIGARQDCIAGGETIADKLTLLRDLEYDFLELALTGDEIDSLSAGSANSYRDDSERTGMPILSTSMGHFGGFAARSADDRATILKEIRQLIQFSSAIGAQTILLATREDDQDVGTYGDLYRSALLPVADEAAEAGIALALEHVGTYKPATVARLVRAIDHRAVGIYFDMGNCLYVGENPLEQARICAPRVAQFHVKGGPVAPLAAMPLVEIREIMEVAGYQGHCALEIAAGEGNRPLKEARGLLKMAGYC